MAMRRSSPRSLRAAVGALAAALVLGTLVGTAIPAAAATGGRGIPVRGVVPSRTLLGTRGQLAGSGTQNLQYNGGPVMQSTSVSYAIFWDPPTLQDGTPTSMSATYQTLIDRYFGDVGGSPLYQNDTQYYQVAGGTKQYIVNSSSFGGAYVDTDPYPPSACTDSATPHGCVSDAQIQAEVSKVANLEGWGGGLTNEFFVYTSSGEGSCVSSICAFTAYCAYHSGFSVGATTYLYANMPYDGTNLAACGVPSSPNGDADADSAINVTSHEHMETVTDPEGNAWFDASGEEIGDKCAWQFGPTTGGGDVTWNGNPYMVQEEWDNSSSSCVLSGPTVALTTPQVTGPTTPFTLGSITVTWNPVPGATAYTVRRQSAGVGSGFNSWTTSSVGASTSTTYSSGTRGRDYCFQVQATDGGQTSNWSPSVCQALPVDDRGLSVTAGSWSRKSGSGFYAGTYSRSTAKGSVLELKNVDVREIDVVVEKLSGGGTLRRLPRQQAPEEDLDERLLDDEGGAGRGGRLGERQQGHHHGQGPVVGEAGRDRRAGAGAHVGRSRGRRAAR